MIILALIALFFVIAFLCFLLLLTATTAARPVGRDRFFASFVEDDAWVCDGPVVRSRDDGPPALIRPVHGPKHSLAGWHIEVEGVAVGPRTTLLVKARDALDVFGGAAGDIEIGVPHFDRSWVLRGSAHDVVRGVLLSEGLLPRLEAYLVSGQVTRLNVDVTGRLTIATVRRDVSNEGIRALLHDARGIAAALSEASSAPPRGPPSTEPASSLSSSGSPVAIAARR